MSTSLKAQIKSARRTGSYSRWRTNLTHAGHGNLVEIHRALPDNKQGQFPKTVLPILILKSNRNLGFFPAKIAPCFVEALDHICPLCSAGFASPDTILSRKSFPIFLLEFNISFLQKCFKGEPGSVDMDKLFCQIHGLHARGSGSTHAWP